MTKVYVLSSGDYSDWTIDGIFASQEEAQAVLDAERAAVPVELLSKFHSRFNDNIEGHTLGEVDGGPSHGFVVRISASDGTVRNICSTDVVVDVKPRLSMGGEEITGFGKTVEHARRSAEEHRRKLAAGLVE